MVLGPLNVGEGVLRACELASVKTAESVAQSHLIPLYPTNVKIRLKWKDSCLSAYLNNTSYTTEQVIHRGVGDYRYSPIPNYAHSSICWLEKNMGMTCSLPSTR